MKYEIKFEELKIGKESFYLPDGWDWEPREFDGLTPDGSEVVIFNAVQTWGDGYVWYDGVDCLKVDGVCWDDCGSVQRAVEAANRKTITRIEKMWKKAKK